MEREHNPIFCYVTDRHALQAPPIFSSLPSTRDRTEVTVRLLHDCIRRAVAGGVAWIQIREKDIEARTLVELTRFAVAETHLAGARVLVNDRLDVALAANAGGVHLGEKSLPVAAVVEWRQAASRTDFLIGVSCHSLESARAAERGGADYIFFGPVYATPFKTAYGEPQGIESLREVRSSVGIPVLAIGGVNQQNAAECIAAGAAGIAAIRMYQK